MRETSTALAVGGTMWLFVISVYWAALMARGRSDLAIALLYNAPVAFLFLVLLAHMAIRALRLGVTSFLRLFGGTLLIWVVGAIILYLRLVSKSLEVSGHLAWLPLLTVQSWLHGFPSWVVALGVLSIASALYLKLAVFQGPSGIPGLVAGVLLAGTMVLLDRGRIWAEPVP